jgi:hypothetical protein
MPGDAGDGHGRRASRPEAVRELRVRDKLPVDEGEVTGD